MGFLSDVGASVIGALLVPLVFAGLYLLRKRLVRWFWEASADYVRDLVPSKVETEVKTKTERKVWHDSKEYRLSLDKKTQLSCEPSGFIGSVEVELLDVDGDWVHLKDLGEVLRLSPHEGAKPVTDERFNREFWIEANRERHLRGSLIAFDGQTGPVSVLLIHARNVSEDKGEATIVLELFAGHPDDSWEGGLG